MSLTSLRESPFEGYAYAYPHKTAYRAFTPPRDLRDVWAGEDKRALIFYAHVPFCEMRCGFCNLFTTVGLTPEEERSYLDAVERHARAVQRALPSHSFAAAAIGGGTPTLLSTEGLERLLGICEAFGASPALIPMSVETSPRTAEVDKLRVLRQAGVRRISIGVQSFDEAETGALGRPQRPEWVVTALDRIRAEGPPVLNIDLMFGMPGQTTSALLASINRALDWAPEELYLYPLYVRPLTGLGRKGRTAGDDRLELYREGRDRLRAAGYEQVSLRFFRRCGVPPSADTCCQEEGTVGVGCGARSYTRTLHYSSDWAVSRDAVRGIIDGYLRTSEEDFGYATHGAEVSLDDQRRRYVLKTLLRREGTPLTGYRTWFGSDPLADLPALQELFEEGLAERTAERLQLTDAGLELSDAIGPWLYSPAARERMNEFELR
jgi:oxygen-independent coproporphyrinogen-3 oxidase